MTYFKRLKAGSANASMSGMHTFSSCTKEEKNAAKLVVVPSKSPLFIFIIVSPTINRMTNSKLDAYEAAF